MVKPRLLYLEGIGNCGITYNYYEDGGGGAGGAATYNPSFEIIVDKNTPHSRSRRIFRLHGNGLLQGMDIQAR